MNALLSKVAVTLLGEEKQRHLIFDLNAHVAFEAEVGQPLLQVISDLGTEMRLAEAEQRTPRPPAVSVVRALLWAGLLAETVDDDGQPTERTLSLHKVGSMMDLGQLMNITEQIGLAFRNSMQGLPKGNPPKTPAQIRGERKQKRRP